MKVLLLPGLDGSGRLFRWFEDMTPSGFECSRVRYPDEPDFGYPEYASLVVREYLPREPCVLVAESFSGPVAVLVAAGRPEGVAAVVLCNSFVTPPRWRGLRHLPLSVLLGIRVPWIAAAMWLVGFGRASDFIEAIREANPGETAPVRASRLRAVLSVDVRSELARTAVPVMHLRGADDRLVRARSAHRTVAARPDIHAVTIPGPHLLLQVAPRESWRAICSWLQSSGLIGSARNAGEDRPGKG